MTDTRSSTDEAPAGVSEKFDLEFEVLRAGEGLIFTGDYDVATNRFTTLKRGDKTTADSAIVERLAERGLVRVAGKK